MLSAGVYAESKTTIKPIAVTADGQKIIAYFSKEIDGKSTTLSHPSPRGYYRILINQSEQGFLVQDFYQDTGTKQSSPLFLKDTQDLDQFDVVSAVGDILLYTAKGEIISKQTFDQESNLIQYVGYSLQGKILLENTYDANSPLIKTKLWHSNGVLAFDLISDSDLRLIESKAWLRTGKEIPPSTCFVDQSIDLEHARLDRCTLQLKSISEKYLRLWQAES